MKIKNLNNELGFSLIEVILASALFIIFSTGIIVLVISGFNSNRLSAEETIGVQFASEGIEAVKSIKNQAYTNLINSSGVGVVRNGTSGVWEFSGTNNVFNVGKDYTRVVKVEAVNRDGAPPLGNIVASGGTLDVDSKKITSTVSWNFNTARANSVELITYLSDWRKPLESPGPIMMAYSKNTTTPFYRTWDGSVWSTEGSASVVGGNINYIVLKVSRTRNEAVLGTLDSNGNIYAQVWNGTTWGNLQLMVNLGSANATTRSFDIAYEKNGDRLVIVYPTGAGNVDFAYRTWDGVSWSSASTITTPPTTAIVRWIDMTQNPISSSNEIAMIMMDNNVDVYGMLWTGSTWSDMGAAAVWDASAAIATEKVVDVAYEQTSGHPMFIWGDTGTGNYRYRIWDGSNLTACSPDCTLLSIAGSGGVGNWIELVSRPSSDELMFGTLDGGTDLNTRKWSGSAWDTATQHPRHTAGAENNSSMVFDVVWETHTTNPGEAWILYGNSTAVSAKQWSGTAWGSATTLSGSDDTSFIRLKADPISGAVFAGIYEDSSSSSSNRDITERRLTGGGTTWSAENIIWGGPTSASPVFFRIDIGVR